jgi:hypothetical protein
MAVKPPLGIMPKKYHDEKRFIELCGAIKRYYDAEFPIPIEWIEEWNELVKARQLTTAST